MTEENDGQKAAMFPGTFTATFYKISDGVSQRGGTMPGQKLKSLTDMNRKTKQLGRIQQGPTEQPGAISYIINQHGRIARVIYTRKDGK